MANLHWQFVLAIKSASARPSHDFCLNRLLWTQSLARAVIKSLSFGWLRCLTPCCSIRAASDGGVDVSNNGVCLFDVSPSLRFLSDRLPLRDQHDNLVFYNQSADGLTGHALAVDVFSILVPKRNGHTPAELLHVRRLLEFAVLQPQHHRPTPTPNLSPCPCQRPIPK